MHPPPAIERLGRGWERHLGQLLGAAEQSLTISSAYVTATGVDFLVRHASPAVLANGALVVLTDLAPEHAAQGSTDPDAIGRLFDRVPGLRLVHLPRLHGKVYVADDQQAIVTSGNLTAGGLRLNAEYGLHLSDPHVVGGIHRDLLDYAALGATLGRDALREFCAHAHEARTAAAERVTPEDARQRLDEAIRRARDVLVRGYVGDEPVHAVFARAALYVLAREGPMTTPELHEHIRALHPDLCGDENRVIGGVSFGRKWKHAVRTAQQRLKESGAIQRSEDGRWNAL